ncbi:hypothetical protein GAYE_SCF63G6654 [Galdieria yellowstonensis]|uniref:Uncharacterized protein n=1 Tax=Galdieria yellowstonensis TaxID=3028027 RepID=A0AAV9IMW8_9RHOD|nr:hypothetical protein GAYE_SCF63G6654 [Galdieria yellowstonensis]
MTDSTAASWRTSTSPSCSTFLSWKRLYGLYQRYILPEYQKPLLYTFLGILFLSLWRLVWKVSPLDLFHWLDVEYYLQNEDGTTFGYVYFPLGTILWFIIIVTVFTKVTNRLQSHYYSRRTS